MNGIELFYWFAVIAAISIACGYISFAAARAFNGDTEAQIRALNVGTVSYTDADTFHRTNRDPDSGSDCHGDLDPGTLGDSDAGPRPVHRLDVGYRPRLAVAGRDSDSTDAETLK